MTRKPIGRTSLAALAMLAVLAMTPALAQDDESDGGLQVGPGPGVSQAGGSTADGAVLSELRAIHERLGEIIAGLDGTAARGDAMARLESRVAALERQVRRSAAQEARQQLESIRTTYEGDGDPEALAGRIEDVRTNLEQAYISATDRDVDQQVIGRELTTQFDALVEMVRGGGDAGEAFGAIDAGLEGLARQGAPERGDTSTEGEAAADAEATADGDDAETQADGEDPSADEQAPEDGQDEQDAPPEEAPDAEAEAAGEAYEPDVLGPQIYAANCVACHQGNGQGVDGAFPALAGNEFVTGDPGQVIDVVLTGRGGMPSFASLSNQEVAAVITHERTSWGNDASEVTPSMVETIREGGDIAGGQDDQPDEPQERPGAAN